MLQWKKSKGRQYVFFQSHPGFAFSNENVTQEFYNKIMCKDVGDALHLVVERGQRWKCPTYREGVQPGPPDMADIAQCCKSVGHMLRNQIWHWNVASNLTWLPRMAVQTSNDCSTSMTKYTLF